MQRIDCRRAVFMVAAKALHPQLQLQCHTCGERRAVRSALLHFTSFRAGILAVAQLRDMLHVCFKC